MSIVPEEVVQLLDTTTCSLLLVLGWRALFVLWVSRTVVRERAKAIR